MISVSPFLVNITYVYWFAELLLLFLFLATVCPLQCFHRSGGKALCLAAILNPSSSGSAGVYDCAFQKAIFCRHAVWGVLKDVT